MAISDEAELIRVEFFSDAVFAIAITLLILDVNLPQRLPLHAVSTELRHLIPQILSYVLSFCVVGIFWLSHHRIFRYLKRQDTTLLLLNLLFLLLVAFIPFPTRLLAEYGSSRAVSALYPGVLALTAVALYGIWRYATTGRRLVDPALDERTVEIVTIRSLGFASIFLLSMLTVLISVHVAEVVWVLAAATAAGLQVYPFTGGHEHT